MAHLQPMLEARFAMSGEVALPDGRRGRVIGIYFHGSSGKPHYLIEHRDEAGVLYQIWQSEEELSGT
jgi:hypothetical protein